MINVSAVVHTKNSFYIVCGQIEGPINTSDWGDFWA